MTCATRTGSECSEQCARRLGHAAGDRRQSAAAAPLPYGGSGNVTPKFCCQTSIVVEIDDAVQIAVGEVRVSRIESTSAKRCSRA